ncbi:hypothetical protein HDU98_005520 [Podochytrium sp. JEL0797]|nr:hypothetical protein HDU98_005520 [Podochytrium sp. JEL0797]
MAGLVGLCAGCGALFALSVFVPMPFKFEDNLHGIRTTYLIVGLIACAFSVLLVLFLAPKMPHMEDSCPASVDEEVVADGKNSPGYLASTSSSLETAPAKKSVLQVVKEGLLAAKDPKIMLGYVGSFLARGDSIILTMFIPLWMYKVYIDEGLCVAPGGVEDPMIKRHCRDAYSRAMMVSGIAQTAALVGAPIFGILSDRFHATNIVLLSAIMGLISYTCMFFANPLLNSILAIAVFLGLAEIGLIVCNMSLVTSSKSVDESVRGSVAGISSACGSIGILVTSKLGGYLFDNWKEGAPFLILAVGHLVAVLCGIYVFVYERRQRNAGN